MVKQSRIKHRQSRMDDLEESVHEAVTVRRQHFLNRAPRIVAGTRFEVQVRDSGKADRPSRIIPQVMASPLDASASLDPFRSAESQDEGILVAR